MGETGMRSAGSAAYILEAPDFGYEALDRREFVTYEGGRLDSEARSAARPAFFRLIRCLVIMAVSAVLVGGVAVSLTSGTVALLQQNEVMSSQINEVRSTNGDLRIACSLLSRSERITQIATQNLGMVHVSTADRLDVG